MSDSLRSSQVEAIHPLYLYSAMSDVSLHTLSCGRRASAPTSQESWTDCDGRLRQFDDRARFKCAARFIKPDDLGSLTQYTITIPLVAGGYTGYC
jgi:hypothetical protein